MKFLPFKATMPAADKVHLVASRSYVSYSKEDLTRKLSENPYTFLHVIHPDVHGDYSGRRMEYFQEVRKTYLKFLSESIFSESKQEGYYVYKQETPLFTFYGVIGGVSVEDYSCGKIKIHEQTLHAREGRFTDYLEITGINAEPVLLVSHSNGLGDVLKDCMNQQSVFCFTTTDKVKHTLWAITAKDQIHAIRQDFENTNALYIADGHHRSASSVALFERVKQKGEVLSSYENFMALVLPAEQLRIFSFHRLLSLPGFNQNDFISYLKTKGELTALSVTPSTSSNNIGIYFKDQWWNISFFPAENQLDTEWLSKEILQGYFKIEDERSDNRINYVEGLVPTEQLVEKIDCGNSTVLFLIHPIEVNTMTEVADAGRTLPPKSTYILPKLRSGLVIYSMQDAN
jgi:uncharacterized protein (DUF1015 family)